eukprot:gene1179-1356_t
MSNINDNNTASSSRANSSISNTTNSHKVVQRTDTVILDDQKLDLNNNNGSNSRSNSVLTQPDTYVNNNNKRTNDNSSVASSSSTSEQTKKKAKPTNAPPVTSDSFLDYEDLLFEDEHEQSSTIYLMAQDDEKYNDVWNTQYVKLPCSKNNVYKSLEPNDNRYLSKWYLINTVLLNPIENSESLEAAIKAINPRCNWDFQGLHDFFDTECTEAETKAFFVKTLPHIINLALRLPFICPRPIPLLERAVDKEIVLSQRQIASLMANAFLCTIPRQGGNSREDRYPSVNFHSLYSAPCVPSRVAKLKCIINYFQRITDKEPSGNISYHRQVCGETETPDWERSEASLRDFTEGTIEDNGVGKLQVDFANKMIGGGVLGFGCVQEEIRFLINPELIMSRLFTAQLLDNETVIIVGSERFSNYAGYGDKFEWSGDHQDNTPKDSMGRIMTTVVAMDAIKLHGDPFLQYSPIYIERELNKSYCGFYDRYSKTIPPPIATGNWGCGVFGGDRYLKSIIQYMSSSHSGRELVYYAYGDEKFSNELTMMVTLLQQGGFTVGQLYKSLWEYYKLTSKSKSNISLFTYLEAHFG